MSDLISRQDALAEFIDDRDVFDIMESIESLPTAGQNCVLCEYYTEIEMDDGIKGKCTRRTGSEPKTGKWIGDRCSICGSERAWFGQQPNYCPDCGSRMRGEEE